MINEYALKIKSWVKSNKNDLYVAFIIFLTAVGSFGLGRLSAILQEKTPIIFNAQNNAGQARINAEEVPRESAPDQRGTATGKYVASKSGTSYHYPWCPSAAKIKEENKIWFDTKEEAESAGYKPAGNCEGL